MFFFWKKVRMALVAKSLIYSASICWVTSQGKLLGKSKVYVQVIYWRIVSGSASMGDWKESEDRKEETLNCDAVAIKIRAHLMVSFGVKMPFRVSLMEAMELSLCSPALTWSGSGTSWAVPLWAVSIASTAVSWGQVSLDSERESWLGHWTVHHSIY